MLTVLAAKANARFWHSRIRTVGLVFVPDGAVAAARNYALLVGAGQ